MYQLLARVEDLTDLGTSGLARTTRHDEEVADSGLGTLSQSVVVLLCLLIVETEGNVFIVDWALEGLLLFLLLVLWTMPG